MERRIKKLGCGLSKNSGVVGFGWLHFMQGGQLKVCSLFHARDREGASPILVAKRLRWKPVPPKLEPVLCQIHLHKGPDIIIH